MIKSLQSLRFLFALMIFAHHFYVPKIEQFGTFPVVFFFMLSGYVMTLGYGDKVEAADFCYKNFVKKRLLRLLPLNIICLCLFLALPTIMDFWNGESPLYRYKWFVLDVLLLQSWIPYKPINFSGNAVAWFLSDILFCNLIFPLLVRKIKRSNLKVVLLSVLFLYFIIVLFIPYTWVHSLIYINPLFRVVDFLLGIVLSFAL